MTDIRTFEGALQPGWLIAEVTNPWVEAGGHEVDWTRVDFPPAVGNKCETCWDSPIPGTLPAMDSPTGIQRCDACEKFEGDLEAALALAKLVNGVVRFEAEPAQPQMSE